MTDSPREEPRPDRLPEIKNGWLAARRLPEDYDDLDWLVAEVERLRAGLEQVAYMGGDPQYKQPEARAMAEFARGLLADD